MTGTALYRLALILRQVYLTSLSFKPLHKIHI